MNQWWCSTERCRVVCRWVVCLCASMSGVVEDAAGRLGRAGGAGPGRINFRSEILH